MKRDSRRGLEPGPVVFVSYAREDADWLVRFETMLKPLVRNRRLELWSDTLIATGRRWRPEITDAITRADAALLLVSPDFLASDFVMGWELPELITRGVTLAPVLLRPCRFRDAPELEGVQWEIDLLRLLGVAAPEVRSTVQGLALLREALADRRSLIVIDDVWTSAAAEAFRAVGPRGRVLYTTRDPATLRGVRADVRRIDVLTVNAARALLARLAGVPVADLPVDVGRILPATGRVALAIALVSRIAADARSDQCSRWM